MRIESKPCLQWRSCERWLTNFRIFRALITESRSHFEREGKKIYWSVTARWTLQSTKLKDYRTPTRCGLLFTVVAVNWICVRPKGGQKKKNVVFIASYIINQCTWCAYKTPTVLDNCLQLCICRFIFLIFGLSTVPFFMRVSERYFMSCY